MTNVIVTQIVAGLLAPQAFTLPKYLYDVLGSQLFAVICELPRYYLTRTERAILNVMRLKSRRQYGPV